MKQPLSECRKAFIARTKEARVKTGLSGKQMGQALGGMAQDTYKNFETIRELPHEHIAAFCLISGVTADWLFDMERERSETALPIQGRRGRSETQPVDRNQPAADRV